MKFARQKNLSGILLERRQEVDEIESVFGNVANSKHACKFSKKVASSLVVVDEILDCRRESVAPAIQ